MGSIWNFMEENIKRVFLSLIIFTIISILMIYCLINMSDKYENDIETLRKENSELKVKNAVLKSKNDKLKSSNEDLGVELESYKDIVEEKAELKCNCGWYEDFYYENAKGCGAYE